MSQPEVIDAETGKSLVEAAPEIELRKPYVVKVAYAEDIDYDTNTIDGSTYSYFTDLDLNLGDFVIVDRPGIGFGVARVGEMVQYDSKATKWVVDVINTTAYETREKRRIQAEQLKREIDARVKVMDENLKLAAYAKEDPEFAALLNDYKELSKS